jgi:hypothetical protein
LSQLKQGRTSAAAFAAIDATRPLPFTALPALADLAKDLSRKRESDE